MRYRHLGVRYTALGATFPVWPFADAWSDDRLRLLVQGRWRPDADAYETAQTLEVVVDLAGLQDDDVEVQLFEDALVVQGRREIPPVSGGTRYHAAGIRQGPFLLTVPLPVPVDAQRVRAHYERGLLSVSLPKRKADA